MSNFGNAKRSKKIKSSVVDFGKRNREKAKRLERERKEKNISSYKDLLKYVNQNKHKINKEFEEELIEDIKNRKITTKTQIFKRIEKKTKENKINNEIKYNELEKETKKCPNCGMFVDKKYNECPICHNQIIKRNHISPEEAKRNIQKKKLRNIVEKTNLSFLSKIILLEKIKNEEITKKQELKVAMSKDLVGEYKLNLLKEKTQKNKSELKKTIEQTDIDDDLKEIIVNSINMARIADDDYISKEIRKINLIQTIFSPNHISSEPPYLFRYELRKLYENKIPNEEDIQKAIKRVRGRIHKPSGGGSSSGGDGKYHPHAKWGW